jgi:hypothetical protein
MTANLTRRTVAVAAVLATLAGVSSEDAPALAQQPRSRAEFMRTKLEHSKRALEGLTLENYGAIVESARALRRLSQAAEWEVPIIPNAVDYVAYTGEFQRLTDEMSRKAQEKNIDGATLAYMRLTMNCVSCHKYVRGLSH